MIAELKNSKNCTMHEDEGDDINADATIPSTIIIKDERISNIASASVSASASASTAASVLSSIGGVTATHLQPHHVVLKDESESGCGAIESTQTNYKRKLMFALGYDDDDDGSGGGVGGVGGDGGSCHVRAATGISGVPGILEKDNMEMADRMQPACKKPKLCMEKEQMFELFQPWALKTYGDQAKTKTITLRKKARILKALEGKEHSRPDSSKFRFWVKSKAFTTSRPECFETALDYPASSNTEYPNNVDLYVASTTKDFGQRTYRKVAVVEEFFNIIYNIHVDMGGRSGRHAGQKRTYRIITETYAFLPREAVTRFLSACPECKKNLRPLSPGRSTADEDIPNDSSTEIDVLNDSSMEVPRRSTPTEDFESPQTVPPLKIKRKSLIPSPVVTKEDLGPTTESPVFSHPSMMQKIRINPNFQTQSFDPESMRSAAADPGTGGGGNGGVGPQMNIGMLNRESFLRYYDFMRRLYGQSMPPAPPEARKTDDTPSTSAAATSLHCEPIRESFQQTCAINLSKSLSSYVKTPKIEPPVEEKSTVKPEEKPVMKPEPVAAAEDEDQVEEQPPQQLDLRKVKPITSTYLQLTRSMGLSDADALKFDDLEPPMPTPPVPDTASDANSDDPYAGLMKDADKLKLMLLAWNYQNSNAVRNGTEGPDLGVVGGLWAQYQNALAQNATKMETSISPVPRTEESSPMENQDETNSSGQKDEDEGSEDDSDDKLDQQAHDPERLKAFNMFVRLFVDENLDRIIPISKQPKEKIQAIIDSCARQFPEFSERSRKRIRTYLKSCRRNKKAREGWDNTTRPTPAHLTSVQAEQILAIACENESMNAKRMRIGLDPITQAVPLTTSTSSTSTAVTSDAAATSTPFTSGFRSTPNPSTSESEALAPTTTSTQGGNNSSARSSPLALTGTTSVGQPLGGGGTAAVAGLSNGNTTVTSVGAIPTSSPLYRPTDFTSPSSTSPYAARTPTYPSYFPAANATPTDLSMKPSSVQQPTQSITSTAAATSSSLSPNTRPPPPLVTHKLSANEITAARQVITAYRESAAFLLRTADQVEQLLVQQQ